MLTFEYLVDNGGQIPRFYGIAYRDLMLRAVVCYPIPLNWLVRWERALGFFLRRLFPWQHTVDKTGRYHKLSYDKGYKAGVAHVYKTGLKI